MERHNKIIDLEPFIYIKLNTFGHEVYLSGHEKIP